MKQHKRVSVIIPAWNEAAHIGMCLQAVANQTVKPDEVIVVDNNSTDDTAKIASSFPFVKLLHQPKQGLIPTRNLGFRTATGDILVRIDADSILEPNWIERAVANFARDPKLGGITGFGVTALAPGMPWRGTLLCRLYLLWGVATFRVPVFWGANMALRRDAWEQIKPHAALRDQEVHEDLDLSILLASSGWKTHQDSKLRVQKNGSEYYEWPKLWAYTQKRFATMRRHRARGSYKTPGAQFISPVISWALYAVLWVPGFLFWGSSLFIHKLKQFGRLFGTKPS